jgi:hypothetical protein
MDKSTQKFPHFGVKTVFLDYPKNLFRLIKIVTFVSCLSPLQKKII